MAKRQQTTIYNAKEFGGDKEVDLIRLFDIQKEDARIYFVNCIKPRLDRSYKLYIADNRDRAREIEDWQANIFVPYVQAVVETLKPRILDARPDLQVQGRTEESQAKATRLNALSDYTWEIAGGDKTSESIVNSALIYGTGYIQTYWKRDVRKRKFLVTKNLGKKKYKWEEREETFYDAPYFEWVDNYSLWYDWHNVEEDSKQYWFKRLILTEAEIKDKYPMFDKKRLSVAIENGGGDLTDYAAIRNMVKLNHEKINKGADWFAQSGPSGVGGSTTDIYKDSEAKMHEVFEWWRPFDDEYAVMVNGVPILKGAVMPNPYDFKEAPFTGVPYMRPPGEYEGYGIPLLLENPQIMLNMIKNQRLDAMTLNIHKMWIVNPLANVNKEELVARPFGIIYTPDPNGVREVQTSDIKPSSYREEELIKGDMRYASGVDDFSMGVGSGGMPATGIRHLRESTLERVRLFINHLGDGYSKVLRHWICMYRQFFSNEMIIRISGDNGELEFPVIEKDDLMGEFDYKATVLPSIAGQNDVKKKQDMDLFQLLINLPFIDPEKLVSKILYDWNWNLESVKKQEMEAPMPEEGMPPQEGEMSPEEMMAMMGAGAPGMGAPAEGGAIPANVAAQALAMLGEGMGPTGAYNEMGGKSPMGELSAPVDLMNAGPPPTPRGVMPAGNYPVKTTNIRGMNRGGKVNTNIPLRPTSNPEASLQNRALNIQK